MIPHSVSTSDFLGWTRLVGDHHTNLPPQSRCVLLFGSIDGLLFKVGLYSFGFVADIRTKRSFALRQSISSCCFNRFCSNDGFGRNDRGQRNIRTCQVGRDLGWLQPAVGQALSWKYLKFARYNNQIKQNRGATINRPPPQTGNKTTSLLLW